MKAPVTAPPVLSDILRDSLVLVAQGGGAVSAATLRSLGARDVLLLERDSPATPQRERECVRKRFVSPADLRKCNCNVAILHGRAAAAAADKKKFGQYRHLLIAPGWPLLCAAIGLLRYGHRRALVRRGWVTIENHGRKRRYLVLEANSPPADNRRQHGPAGLSPLQMLQRLKGVDYVVLRWSEMIEAGRHEGDIDLLVSPQGLADLKERFSGEICTYPLDVYTTDGQGGHSYKSVPYFTAPLARGLLDSATFTAAGIRVATPWWRFLAFCYHLTFQNKSERIAADTVSIGPQTYHKPHYYPELQRLAALAGQPVPATYDDIEKLLREAGVMPSLDLIGFYSNNNAFLKKRYFERAPLAPGLTTFFLRDFGNGLAAVDELRGSLQKEFTILAEGAVDETNRNAVTRGVRGGNWADARAPGGIALPVYWFVCHDPAPIRPSARTRRKHPRVDNERIRLKDMLRHRLAAAGHEKQRLVHSSDNTAEALDHIAHLGLCNDPRITPHLPVDAITR